MWKGQFLLSGEFLLVNAEEKRELESYYWASTTAIAAAGKHGWMLKRAPSLRRDRMCLELKYLPHEIIDSKRSGSLTWRARGHVTQPRGHSWHHPPEDSVTDRRPDTRH